MYLMQMGVGTQTEALSIRNPSGGLIPMQAAGDGVTSFRVTGRVDVNAPWVEIKAAGTADFLESFSWVPYIQLEVLSGTGMVELYIAEGL